MRKIICWLLTITMLLSLGAGIAAAEEVVNPEAYELYQAAEDNNLPIADGNVRLSVYVEFDEYSANFMSSYDEHPVIKEIEARTGIDLEFIHPPIGDDGTYFNILLTSGEYPDIFITYDFDNYPGGVSGAVNDGILTDMDPLIRQYAKNYLGQMTHYDASALKSVTDDEGKLRMQGGFSCDYLTGNVNAGFICRKDMLDKLDVEIPKTVEEMTEVLRALKESGVEAPLGLGSLDNYRFDMCNLLSGAWGVTMNGYQINDEGKVVFSRVADGYRDYLRQMNAWYNEGFIDRDFVNRDVKDVVTMMYNDRTAFGVIGNWQATEIVELGPQNNPDFEIAPVRMLRLTDPEAPYHLAEVLGSDMSGYRMFISESSPNKEVAIKLLDYLFNMDSIELAYWGSGEQENGTTTYIINDEGLHEYGDAIMNDPDWPYETVRHKYTLQIFQTYMIEEPERLEYDYPICQANWEAWSYKSDDSMRLPATLSLTAEESSIITGNQTDIDTYADEMIYRFILGEVDIETGWDSYVQTLEKMGVSENVAAYQAAYERYLAR